jgi:hypothetical protein
MTMMRTLRLVTLLLTGLALSAGAVAQTPVTEADLTRLETTAGEIARQVPAIEKTDATLAGEVRKALTTLQEEITYLKVKLRREGAVTRADYGDVRDRLETLRVRAQGQKVTAQPLIDDAVERVYSVPVGTVIDVRLHASLNSRTAKVEQRFEATTVADVSMNGLVVIPAGTLVRGFVSSVRAAGKVDRRGSLTLSFDEMRIKDRSLKLRASVEQALDGKMAQDATRVGAGAVVGGIIGGLLGGSKGALVGVLVGAGGTIASTEGSDVDLPAGTLLRIRLDQPVDVPVGGGTD